MNNKKPLTTEAFMDFKDINWTYIALAILAIASAIGVVSNAVEKVIKVWKTAKAPNDVQDKRLDELEKWRRDVDLKLNSDKSRLDSIEEGDRSIQRALIALLDHGIDGNNIKQMQDAKAELQNYLINR